MHEETTDNELGSAAPAHAPSHEGDHGNAERYPDELIIFSLADGFVWATCPGSPVSIKLGPYEAVTAMMSDFLAQCAIGNRLMKGMDKLAP